MGARAGSASEAGVMHGLFASLHSNHRQLYTGFSDSWGCACKRSWCAVDLVCSSSVCMHPGLQLATAACAAPVWYWWPACGMSGVACTRTSSCMQQGMHTPASHSRAPISTLAGPGLDPGRPRSRPWQAQAAHGGWRMLRAEKRRAGLRARRPARPPARPRPPSLQCAAAKACPSRVPRPWSWCAARAPCTFPCGEAVHMHAPPCRGTAAQALVRTLSSDAAHAHSVRVPCCLTTLPHMQHCQAPSCAHEPARQGSPGAPAHQAALSQACRLVATHARRPAAYAS